MTPSQGLSTRTSSRPQREGSPLISWTWRRKDTGVVGIRHREVQRHQETTSDIFHFSNLLEHILQEYPVRTLTGRSEDECTIPDLESVYWCGYRFFRPFTSERPHRVSFSFTLVTYDRSLLHPFRRVVSLAVVISVLPFLRYHSRPLIFDEIPTVSQGFCLFNGYLTESRSWAR